MGTQSTIRFLYTVGVLAGALVLAGCPKRPEVGQAAPGALGPAAATAPAPLAARPAPRTVEIPVTRPTPPVEMAIKPAPQIASVTPAASSLKDIFFDFDDATIRGDQQAVLNQDFAWLKAHPNMMVAVEGSCDERGTEEYNLALGQRRAETVKDHLVAAGIPAERITTISYGKERPFALGHDENAWRLNRRDHFAMAK